jgi:hypothetical protein
MCSVHMQRAIGVVALIAAAARPAAAESFGADLAFLRQHTDVIVLEGEGGARVAVVPAWQGRVITSSAAGAEGASFGWINRGLIAAGKPLPHFNPYGGEDRLWLGPEGSQFSIFFRAGDPFDLAHWQTPAPIDTERWPVAAQDARSVRFTRSVQLTNRSGTRFDLSIDRTIRLVGAPAVAEACGRPPGKDLRWVGFQSENRLTNTGRAPWSRKGGLLSLWSMGMFAPSPATTVVVPLAGAARPAVVNDVYFGRVPPERLVLQGETVFFRADGQQRGKIGVRAAAARPVLGSYDAANKVLTVVWYTLPGGNRPYVNSLWSEGKDAFSGDAVNSYNDGPPAPGARPLGPFYELESSSPGAELAPGAALAHTHRTLHFQGEAAALDQMARACLGVGVAEIQAAFAR